ncbi:MAG: FAD-dependent oxidoreductase [bacterium]|nr:FAD-dependent oxidoreductase [bacterium]MDZ4285968.1 FAD-dependent oxidoreductase [Candidatus Sungbacteria bacterium]
MYDVIIIGGGPAGAAAAVYTARKQLKTLMLTEGFGGQSIVSDDIQNWIGEQHISGFDLSEKMEKHVKSFSDFVDLKMPEKAVSVKAIRCNDQNICDFEVATDKGNTFEGKTVILCAGARRKKLGIPGEEEFNGKGVAYCSTCDAPLFKGKAVAVVGGGNAGLEAVIDLVPYAAKVYLLEFSDVLKGDPVTQDQVRAQADVEIIFKAQAKQIMGEKFVNGFIYTDIASNQDKTLDVQGVFVEIGSVPNSDIAKGLVEIDKYGQVIIDSKFATTSRLGIFAAGDITDDPFKQNNVSMGDGVKAALSAYNYILKQKSQ